MWFFVRRTPRHQYRFTVISCINVLPFRHSIMRLKPVCPVCNRWFPQMLFWDGTWLVSARCWWKWWPHPGAHAGSFHARPAWCRSVSGRPYKNGIGFCLVLKAFMVSCFCLFDRQGKRLMTAVPGDWSFTTSLKESKRFWRSWASGDQIMPVCVCAFSPAGYAQPWQHFFYLPGKLYCMLRNRARGRKNHGHFLIVQFKKRFQVFCFACNGTNTPAIRLFFKSFRLDASTSLLSLLCIISTE